MLEVFAKFQHNVQSCSEESLQVRSLCRTMRGDRGLGRAAEEAFVAQELNTAKTQARTARVLVQGTARITVSMKKIHFGSLENQLSPQILSTENEVSFEGRTLRELEQSTESTAPPASTRELTAVQAIYLAELEEKHRAKKLPVPTDDKQVREWLRCIAEPITLFGEGAYERRERLRRIISAQPSLLSKLSTRFFQFDAGTEARADDREEFYVPGSEALLSVRKWLAEWSLERGRNRLIAERELRQRDPAVVLGERKGLYESTRGYTLHGSQFGSSRPLSAISLNADASLLVTGDFGGECSIWNGETCELQTALCSPQSGGLHKSRIGSAIFSPTEPSLLATCDGEGKLGVWRVSDPHTAHLARELKGHTARIGRCAFHPSGTLLGSASFDYSWRLWDIERGIELQLQEGHSRPVYSIAFHGDGALVATGGLDAHCRLWDLRSGRAIWTLQDHHKSILSIDFHPITPLIATASEDGTIKGWDMRKQSIAWTIPAHTSVVSSCRWSHCGSLLLSSGFDGAVKIWGSHDRSLLCTLDGHDGKVYSADISPDRNSITTCGIDRTFKLWK